MVPPVVAYGQAGAVLGILERCPPLTTGRPNRNPAGVASRRDHRRQKELANRTVQSKKELRILQWNGEGLGQKKQALAARLALDKIDVACIQETHLRAEKAFSVHGYQTFRQDRDGHKGGVLILVKNQFPARLMGTPPATASRDEAGTIGVELQCQEELLWIYSYYCPNDKPLSLDQMSIPRTGCIVAGDFNSHSERWGYAKTNARGDEVEEWELDSGLFLVNMPEDPPTCYSRRHYTSSTPDLAFVTADLTLRTSRTVLDQLAGSDHRPVLLTVETACAREVEYPLPRWNYVKADWGKFSQMTDEITSAPTSRVKDMNSRLTNAILKAAKCSIPRGCRKNYTPYWTPEIQTLEAELVEARDLAERESTERANIAYKLATAKYRREVKLSARKRWVELTEGLNFDRDGHKLWKLFGAMSDTRPKRTPVVLKHNDCMCYGKKAADALVNQFADSSKVAIPKQAIAETEESIHDLCQRATSAEAHLSAGFSAAELAEALSSLKAKKSPGRDGVTNEMLQHLGPKATASLLKLFNTSWKKGQVPQAWKDAILVPIHKPGKDRTDPASYRPISLLSCIGKLMEKLVNTRLTWHFESKKLFSPEQCGFRRNLSTEDQVTYIAQEIEDGFQDGMHVLSVQVDMEKAFDTVWKEGLKLKLLRLGVEGLMFDWLCSYLENRTARVQLQGLNSRQRTMEQGVPQGGVLSPTLFLAYVNDISTSPPAAVNSAMYADDLAVWAKGKDLTKLAVTMQTALTDLEAWSKQWYLRISPNKTTYTVFSLSKKVPPVSLMINGRPLPEERNPTYLGVTLDKRLTWRTQIDKSIQNAKKRTCLMRRLAGSTWGANHSILKKLYTGMVRPVLEYGSAASATASQYQFAKISKVQNTAARIITGAMKSTRIQSLESVTGLQPMADRRDAKVILQAEKFKRLPAHPMHYRMSGPVKKRITRCGFVENAKRLTESDPILGKAIPEHISQATSTPLWAYSMPELRETIAGIGPKGTQTNSARRGVTERFIGSGYPETTWSHVYTDGSAKNATSNGGGGIFMCLKNGELVREFIPTGKFSSNYRAEGEAIGRAAVLAVAHREQNHNRIVVFTDALSVVTALKSEKGSELGELRVALANMTRAYDRVVIQWIPSHCGIRGNEEADRLANRGSRSAQADFRLSYNDAKAVVRGNLARKWADGHPSHIRTDQYYRLARSEQVILMRLRTGHNRLNSHMFRTFKIGTSAQCPCGAAEMTTEHVLMDCPSLGDLRRATWRSSITLNEKLYGSLISLKKTAKFVKESGISV